MSSGGTPSPSSSDEQREQQLQQNLASVDGSFIPRDASSPINTSTRARAPHFPSLANAQDININESRLLQSQDINLNHISNNEHHASASRISGGKDDRNRTRMSSQQQRPQQQQPTPSYYAYGDDRATSGSSDGRQLLIQSTQALEYDRLQRDHTQRRQLQVVSSTTDDHIPIAQQSERTTSYKDDGNDIGDARVSILSTHTRSPRVRDALTLGYKNAQIREYNRLHQAHMKKQKKQQPRLSDLATHPIRGRTHPIESRPINKNNGDVGEGSPFGDLDVLESQLRERVHVSSRYSHLTTGDNVSSQNAESISQLGMASSVPSNCDNVGISAVALEAQLREYRKLHRSHIQQQQQFQPSRGIESIEEEQTVVAQNVTPVIGARARARARARRTADLRNSSRVGDSDRFVDNCTATLNPTEQNTSSVICSSCKNRLYTVPMAELFICQICRNITPMRP